jgi:hypothetical protein
MTTSTSENRFESRVLRKTVRPKRGEVTREWRRLHDEKLYDLYHSPNIIQVIKSRIMSWAEHVALMEEKRNLYRVLL